MNKKILITGGCGFIGSSLAIFLKKKGFDVTSLDNLYRKGSKLNLKRLNELKIKNLNLDIRNYNSIIKIKKIFDLVIDCCAEPSVEKSQKSNLEAKRVFDTNLTGTFNILSKCLKDNATIIFLSSSRVYSISALNKLKFQMKKKYSKKIGIKFLTNNPKSLYGYTKFSSEKLIEEFNFSNNLNYIINRVGVVSGPWQFGKTDQGFLSLWSWSYLNKKNLKYIGYNGSGLQVRDILHVDDLCEIIFIQISRISKICNLTFSFGGGIKNAINLKSLSKKLEKISSNKIFFSRIKKTSKYDIPYFVADNKILKKTYNWAPKRKIDEIIFDVYCWQKNNIEILKKYFY